MLVKFRSSVTGEIIMFAETAKTLLEIINKESTAHGAIALAEMLPAAATLREATGQEPEQNTEASDTKEIPVGLAQRAWPLIDMLERTARAGEKANLIWEAPSNF